MGAETMKNSVNALLVTIALVGAQAAVPFEGGGSAPEWSWAAAQSAIESVDTRTAREELQRMAMAGDNKALTEHIAWITERSGWPAPAREYTLFSFTHSLADLAPGTVHPGVLRQLAAIRPEVRIPHPDDDRLGMVLFNIPAAARGVATEWRRRDAAGMAAHDLASGAEDWISAYLAGDSAIHAGYLSSLDNADAAALNELAGAVERRMDANPGLAPVLARIGIVLADENRFARALGGGPVPDVAQLARAAGEVFDAGQALRALDTLENTAPVSTTSAVLAEFAPALTRNADGTQRLFELVGHESLGLTAAMALARHGDAPARLRLAVIASKETDDASRHASIALSAPVPERSLP
jgi:hypothetical protein